MTKYLYVTASSGAPLTICPYCKKVQGDHLTVLHVPFYEQLGDEHPYQPEMLNILFKPVEYCTCKEQKQ